MHLLLVLLFIISINLPTGKPAGKLARKAFGLERSGVLDEAEVNYKRALAIHPSQHQTRLNLGNTLFHQQRYQEALREYQRLTTSPTVPRELKAKGLHNAGLTYLQLGMLDKSRTALLASLACMPGDSTALYSLSYVLQLQSRSPDHEATAPKEANNEKDAGNDQQGEKESADLLGQESLDQLFISQDLKERAVREKINQGNTSEAKVKDKYW